MSDPAGVTLHHGIHPQRRTAQSSEVSGRCAHGERESLDVFGEDVGEVVGAFERAADDHGGAVAGGAAVAVQTGAGQMMLMRPVSSSRLRKVTPLRGGEADHPENEP
jgi:hypothetical protein